MTERKQPLRTLPDEMRLKRDGKSIRIYWRWRTANTELLWWAFLIVNRNFGAYLRLQDSDYHCCFLPVSTFWF
ncbi:MAG: hypothetical protein AAFR56_21695 [Chloroflexota bacterium]